MLENSEQLLVDSEMLKKTALEILEERCKSNPELQKAYEIEKENYMNEIQKIEPTKTQQLFIDAQIEFLKSMGFDISDDYVCPPPKYSYPVKLRVKS